MAIGTIRKDPNSTRKYTINWSRFLAKCSETPQTIADSDWLVPDGLEKADESKTDTKTVIWLKGGTLGAHYLLVNRITTSDDQIEDATLDVIIEER